MGRAVDSVDDSPHYPQPYDDYDDPNPGVSASAA